MTATTARSRVAEHVAAGNCRTCGRHHGRYAPQISERHCARCGQPIPYWTPTRIVRAARRFDYEHGRQPSCRDWRSAGIQHPASSTVIRVFGSWNRMVEAAGLEPRPATWGTAKVVWDKERIAAAMLDWLLRTGTWPRFRDWLSGGDPSHPHANTVLRHFSSWNAAKQHAGWNGQLRRYFNGRVYPNACRACGIQVDGRTRGCRTCTRRHYQRRFRKAEAAASTSKQMATASDPKEVSKC